MNKNILFINLVVGLISLLASFVHSYRINNLSLIDAVFADFRNAIIKYKSLDDTANALGYKFKLALYKLKSKDTLQNIANRTGLNKDTIISINGLSSAYDIYKGRDIYIPNIKGSFIYLEEAVYKDKLSKEYNIPLWLFDKVNKIKRNTLYKGERIFIPFRKLGREELEYFSSSIFQRPVSKGYLSSGFGTRLDPFKRKRTFHGGLDIASFHGSPVYASQAGKVIFTGYNGAYGKLIVITHKYNYKTFYGHLSKILIKNGSFVRKGQFIGRVGSTGRSTGPHLHFEIRRSNNRLDPSRFIHIDK